MNSKNVYSDEEFLDDFTKNELEAENSENINNELNENIIMNEIAEENKMDVDDKIQSSFNNYIMHSSNMNLRKLLGNLKLCPVTIKIEKVENENSNIPYIKIRTYKSKYSNKDGNINQYKVDKDQLINLIRNESRDYNNIFSDYPDIWIKSQGQITSPMIDTNNVICGPRKTNIINKMKNSDIFKDENIFHYFSIDNNKINQANQNKDTKPKKQLSVRQGDWACKQCNNLNFSFRDKCNRCGMAKEVVGYEITEKVALNRNLNGLNGFSSSNNKYSSNYISSHFNESNKNLEQK